MDCAVQCGNERRQGGSGLGERAARCPSCSTAAPPLTQHLTPWPARAHRTGFAGPPRRASCCSLTSARLGRNLKSGPALQRKRPRRLGSHSACAPDSDFRSGQGPGAHSSGRIPNRLAHSRAFSRYDAHRTQGCRERAPTFIVHGRQRGKRAGHRRRRRRRGPVQRTLAAERVCGRISAIV